MAPTNPLAPRPGTEPYIALGTAKYVRDQVEGDTDKSLTATTTPQRVHWLTQGEADRLGPKNVEPANNPAVRRQVRQDAQAELGKHQTRVDQASGAIEQHDEREKLRRNEAAHKRETLQRELASAEARLETAQGEYDKTIDVVGEEDEGNGEGKPKGRGRGRAPKPAPDLKPPEPPKKPEQPPKAPFGAGPIVLRGEGAGPQPNKPPA